MAVFNCVSGTCLLKPSGGLDSGIGGSGTSRLSVHQSTVLQEPHKWLQEIDEILEIKKVAHDLLDGSKYVNSVSDEFLLSGENPPHHEPAMMISTATTGCRPWSCVSANN